MPNHCSCCLAWEPLGEFGDAQIVELVERISESDNFVRHLLPVPDALSGIHRGFCTGKVRHSDGSVTEEELREWWTDKDGVSWGFTEADKLELLNEYGALNSIDWQGENWGTKWGSYEQDLDPDGEFVRFDSAWCPPHEAIAKISEMFSHVRFTLAYSEGGMCFWGKEVYEDGECVLKEHSSDYWHEPPSFKDEEEEEAYYDQHHLDRVLPEVAEHLQAYGLHTGG